MSRDDSGTHAPKQSSRGLWIAVFGPDGVGKSAAIDRLPELLGGDFRGYDTFHFRANFGRRDGLPVIAPHAQKPRGLLVSVGKLLYWLLDSWLGHLLLVMPALRRSHLVIFDRYLPDLLVDPVRYRLPASAKKMAAAAVRLAPTPDLCILFDAPAEIVHQRKQELSRAELQRQRNSYRKLFESMPEAVVIDANRPIEEVSRHLAAAITSCLFPATSCPSPDREPSDREAGVPA